MHTERTPSDTEQSGDDQDDSPEEVNLVAMTTTDSPAEVDLMAMMTTVEKWVVDSGASSHYANSCDNITKFKPIASPSNVTTAGGSQLPVVGSGHLQVSSNKALPKVLYVPRIRSNLLSVGSLADRGHLVIFDAKNCFVMDRHDPKKVFLKGSRDPSNRLYTMALPVSHRKLPPERPATTACTVFDQSSPANATERLWHRRLGHPNYQKLYLMSTQQLVVGLPKLNKAHCFCPGCVKGKQHRHPVPSRSSTLTDRPLQLVHTDLCGPMPVESKSKAKYFMIFVDDFTRHCWIYFLKRKSEAFTVFKRFKSHVETQLNSKLGTLRSDRGGEYLSTEFSQYLSTHGIQRQLTTARTPEQNGVAERKNRTLIEAVRTMAVEACIPAFLWEEFFKAANYLQNRCSTQALSKSTPYEKIHGVKPNIEHLRVVGCQAHIWIPKELRTKLSQTSVEAILIGYDDDSKAYRCYCPSDKKIYISRNVKFNETSGQQLSEIPQLDTMSTQFFDEIPLQHAAPPLPDLPLNLDVEPEIQPVQNAPAPPSPQAQVPPPLTAPAIPLEEEPQVIAPPRRSQRARRTSGWLSDFHHNSHLVYQGVDPSLYALEVLNDLDEDMTLQEALDHPGWKKAIQSEYDSLIENDTWELTTLPTNRRALSARWVLRIKPDLNPVHTRLKARLVAKGYEQQAGLDYNETFAPVVKWSTLRTVIALAAALGWPIFHLDVVTAFLNGKLQETIYMTQPPGFEQSGLEHLVCRLKRSIYGLKQSPRTWYEEIDKFLRDHHWLRSTIDPNLYILRSGSSIVLLLLYVDDLLITGNDRSLIDNVKTQLQSKYKMKDLGSVQRYLGVEFEFSSSGILVHQREYAKKVLTDAGMQTCKSVPVPLAPGTSLADYTGTDNFDQHQYCHTVGQLLYLTNTRPDLSYAVSYVSRFMAHPEIAHWQAVLHILRYVQGTVDYGIKYSRLQASADLQGFVKTSPPIKFDGYTDADWAACKSSRRSTGGYLFNLAGGLSPGPPKGTRRFLCPPPKQSIGHWQTGLKKPFTSTGFSKSFNYPQLEFH